MHYIKNNKSKIDIHIVEAASWPVHKPTSRVGKLFAKLQVSALKLKITAIIFDVSDVFNFYSECGLLVLCSLSARFFTINNDNSIFKYIITCVLLDFWVFGAHCLHCVLSASFAVIMLCPVLLFLVYRVYNYHNK